MFTKVIPLCNSEGIAWRLATRSWCSIDLLHPFLRSVGVSLSRLLLVHVLRPISATVFLCAHAAFPQTDTPVRYTQPGFATMLPRNHPYWERKCFERRRFPPTPFLVVDSKLSNYSLKQNLGTDTTLNLACTWPEWQEKHAFVDCANSLSANGPREAVLTPEWARRILERPRRMQEWSRLCWNVGSRVKNTVKKDALRVSGA